MEPHCFDAVACAFVSLLLMHNGTSHHDWLRPRDRQARRKKKKKAATKKRKSKKSNDDDDNDDDDKRESEEDAIDGSDDEGLYENGVSAEERAEIDAKIVESGEQPMINVTGATTTLLEELFQHPTSFVPYVQPILFEASQQTTRPHEALDYGLLMLVQTAATTATEVTALLEKCRKKLASLAKQHAERLGYDKTTGGKMHCRIMLLLWDTALSEAKRERLERKLRKELAEMNAGRVADVTFELFTVSQLQYDVSKGKPDQFVVLQKNNTSPDEAKRLKTVATHQMRKLERSDPQAAIRDFVVGQRIRIQRMHVHLGAGAVEYAQVVDSTAQPAAK